MTGKFPNDRANDRTDIPETYDRDRERLRVSEAGIRDADDPVSGARPETDDVDPLAEQVTEDPAKRTPRESSR
jgi:hypothetical protein